MLRIQVNNLGALKQAEVILEKDFTILAGANNTGKSYLAYLIYGLLKIREDNPHNPLYEKYRKTFYKYFDKDNILRKYITAQGLAVNRFTLFKEHYTTFLKARNQVFYDSVIELFASADLHPAIEISGNFPENMVPTNQDSVQTLQINGVNYQCRIRGECFEITSEAFHESHLKWIKQPLYDFLLSPNVFHLYFFPTERFAFHLLSKNFFKRQAKEQEELGKVAIINQHLKKVVKYLQRKQLGIPHYPLAIRDYFYLINQLKELTEQRSEYIALGQEIEEQLMQGTITVTATGEFQFQLHSSPISSPIHLASSLVKSLAGLVLYFKYLAVKGDVIFIDVPEINLHPAWQRVMVRILVKAVNQGLKIIISTRSEYIIKEINNLIMLSQLSPNVVKTELNQKFGYEELMMLSPEKVRGFWFAEQTVRPMSMNEQGLVIPQEVMAEVESTRMYLASYFR